MSANVHSTSLHWLIYPSTIFFIYSCISVLQQLPLCSFPATLQESTIIPMESFWNQKMKFQKLKWQTWCVLKMHQHLFLSASWIVNGRHGTKRNQRHRTKRLEEKVHNIQCKGSAIKKSCSAKYLITFKIINSLTWIFMYIIMSNTISTCSRKSKKSL